MIPGSLALRPHSLSTAHKGASRVCLPYPERHEVASEQEGTNGSAKAKEHGLHRVGVLGSNAMGSCVVMMNCSQHQPMLSLCVKVRGGQWHAKGGGGLLLLLTLVDVLVPAAMVQQAVHPVEVKVFNAGKHKTTRVVLCQW